MTFATHPALSAVIIALSAAACIGTITFGIWYAFSGKRNEVKLDECEKF